MSKTKTAKRPAIRRVSAQAPHGDGTYLLKLVLYLIVGTQWLWFEPSGSRVPVPIGLLIGLLFALHDHFRIDRKIEYAVLLVATLAGFVAQIGIFVRV